MARIKKPFNPDEYRMSFGDHLEELRARLIHALVGIGIAAIGTFYFGFTIIGWINAPYFRALRQAELPPELIATKVTAPFGIYIKVSLMSAAIISFPWVMHQLWKFISAGLYEHEQRIAYILAPFSGLMVLLGVLFMYYILLPVCLFVLVMFSQSYPPPGETGPSFMDRITDMMKWTMTVPEEEDVGRPDDDASLDTRQGTIEEPQAMRLTIPSLDEDPTDPLEGQFWFNATDNELKAILGGKLRRFMPASRSSLRLLPDQNDHINFVLMLGVGVVVAFQVPVLMTILGWSGIIDPALVSKSRKYCVFICFVLGAVLTPQDPFSMFILALPLWGLFEFGLLLMRRAYPRDEPT